MNVQMLQQVFKSDVWKHLVGHKMAKDTPTTLFSTYCNGQRSIIVYQTPTVLFSKSFYVSFGNIARNTVDLLSRYYHTVSYIPRVL